MDSQFQTLILHLHLCDTLLAILLCKSRWIISKSTTGRGFVELRINKWNIRAVYLQGETHTAAITECIDLLCVELRPLTRADTGASLHPLLPTTCSEIPSFTPWAPTDPEVKPCFYFCLFAVWSVTLAINCRGSKVKSQKLSQWSGQSGWGELCDGTTTIEWVTHTGHHMTGSNRWNMQIREER